MRDIHASGYHGATDKQWCRLLREAARRGSLIVATECRGVEAPFNWNSHQPKVQGGEVTIFWDRDRWQQILPVSDHRGHAYLTRRKFYTGSGQCRPGVVASWVMLERQTIPPWTLLRIGAHFPASVQHGNRFARKARRVAAWVDALRGLRRLICELVGELDPDEITVSADWNVDLSRKRWRAVINHGLRGTGLHVTAPLDGTHRDRVIDGHATTLRRNVVHVLHHLPGFDHRIVLAILNRKGKP